VRIETITEYTQGFYSGNAVDGLDNHTSPVIEYEASVGSPPIGAFFVFGVK